MAKKFMYINAFGGCMNREGVTKTHNPSPIYEAISKAVYDELIRVGYFRKEDLLRDRCLLSGTKVDLTAIGDSIIWPYIIRHLEETHDIEAVIPLAENFFSGPIRRRLASSEVDPEVKVVLAGRAIASGHGKKTSGYAAYHVVNSALVLKHLSRKTKVAQGTISAQEKAASYAKKTGALEDQAPEQIEDLIE